jgi:hypothetical protein
VQLLENKNVLNQSILFPINKNINWLPITTYLVRSESSAGVTIFSFGFWVITQRRFCLARGIVCSSHYQGPVRTVLTGPWWSRCSRTKQTRCSVTTQKLKTKPIFSLSSRHKNAHGINVWSIFIILWSARGSHAAPACTDTLITLSNAKNCVKRIHNQKRRIEFAETKSLK